MAGEHNTCTCYTLVAGEHQCITRVRVQWIDSKLPNCSFDIPFMSLCNYCWMLHVGVLSRRLLVVLAS